MPQCSRCSEISSELDAKGRCGICQYELQQKREWRERNIDKVRAGNRIASQKTYRKHRDAILQRNRQSYWDSHEQQLEYRRLRRMINRDEVNAKRRAKDQARRDAMTDEEKAAHRARWNAHYARRQKRRLGNA